MTERNKSIESDNKLMGVLCCVCVVCVCVCERVPVCVPVCAGEQKEEKRKIQRAKGERDTGS